MSKAIAKRPRRPTRKVRTALRLMIYEGQDRATAAAAVGIRDDSLYRALRSPIVMREYQAMLADLRSSAKPAALRRIIALMGQDSARKVALDAAKYLDGGTERRDGVTVNVGVNVASLPGYVIDDSEHREAAVRILRESGSVRSVLDAEPVE